MTPTYWGWCGCTVWPLVLAERVGRCGRCDQRPIYLAKDISTEPDGLTRDQALERLKTHIDKYDARLQEANE